MKRDYPNQPKIQLWNPSAAANWSLLFTPIFGAWVQSRNWEALGMPDEARRSRRWAYGFMALNLLILFAYPADESSAAPAIRHNPFANIAFVGLVVWYFANGKSQISHVKARGSVYEKKSWKMPLLFGVVILTAYVLLAVHIETILAAHHERQMLEKESVGLVTQVAQRDGEPGTATCSNVRITKELSEDVYEGVATMSNGAKLRVRIELLRKEDRLVVTVIGAL